MFLGFGVLISWGRLALSPSHCALVFAASLNVSTVGNTLSAMLPTAGTTLGSRRKLSNRPWSISPFSSLPLEAA